MIETLKAIPPDPSQIVGIIIVIVIFLAFISRSEKARLETLSKLGEQCHIVQHKTVEALDRNTEMLGRTLQMFDRIERIIKEHDSDQWRIRELQKRLDDYEHRQAGL